jgi:zinc transport system substrate-binding protein
MKDISDAELYFSIGVEFEQSWLNKFKNQNSKLLVKDISKDINKTAMKSHHQDKGHKHKEPINLDPHIWVSPINVKKMAINIYEALSSIDNKNRDYYKKNLESYLIELETLNSEIKTILLKVPKNSKFMVFHPAWGYFAKEYNLQQLVVEVEGKRPMPKQLIDINKEAKKEQVKVIFTQPEFSDQSAKTIPKELNIKVIKPSPLAKNWSENLKNLARAIVNKK